MKQTLEGRLLQADSVMQATLLLSLVSEQVGLSAVSHCQGSQAPVLVWSDVETARSASLLMVSEMVYAEMGSAFRKQKQV